MNRGDLLSSDIMACLSQPANLLEIRSHLLIQPSTLSESMGRMLEHPLLHSQRCRHVQALLEIVKCTSHPAHALQL